MMIVTKRNNQFILISQASVLVAEKYVMGLYIVTTTDKTMFHIINYYAFLGFHRLNILSNSCGGIVSMPNSFASAIVPSIK